MKVITLAGWAQKSESIASLAPDGAEVVCLDYGRHASYDAFLNALPEAIEADMAIAWSLGAQLAMRLVAAGRLQAKQLVLIAPPYQLVADKHFPAGVSAKLVKASRLGLSLQPQGMLRQFQSASLALGDSHKAGVMREARQWLAEQGYHFLEWFDILAGFSAFALEFAGFPQTTIIHGREDAVIPFANGELLAAKIPSARLVAVEKCGHAPHWHDANFVKAVINGL